MKIAHMQPFTIVVALVVSSGVQAGGSAEASARALEHSMQALAYSVEGGLKLASGAAALPLMAAGEIGRVSGQVGQELMDEANAPPHGALPVTDEVITAGPQPDEQLQQLEPVQE